MNREPESRIGYNIPTSVNPEVIPDEDDLTRQALEQALPGEQTTRNKMGVVGVAHGATSRSVEKEEPSELERINYLTSQITKLREQYFNSFEKVA